MISDYQIRCATGFKNIGDAFDGNFGTELGCVEEFEFEDIMDTLKHESWYAVRDFTYELYDWIDDIDCNRNLDSKTKELKIRKIRNQYKWLLEPL